jgi:segregation and condensation protein A
MERGYQVQITAFEGPLDLLLQLIEKEKLSITEISLASVTDQYLAYMESREHVPLEDLSSFLSIAAKLILIKSRALLPILTFTETEEEAIEDLQIQLELYALFKERAKHIQLLLEGEQNFAVRDRYLGLENVYFPPEGIQPQDLYEALVAFIGELEKSTPLPEAALQRIISLEKRITDIQSLIATRGQIAFSEIMKGESPKEEVIVSFLALLELVKQKFILIEQTAHFQEMIIQKI